MKKTALRVVEKPETQSEFDRIFQVRCKSGFMTQAVIKVFGEGEEWHDNIKLGCYFIMEDIEDDLDGILASMDNDYKTMEKEA